MRIFYVVIFTLIHLTLLSQTKSKSNKWFIGNSFNFNFKKNETPYSGYSIIERNTKLTQHQYNTTPLIGKQLNSKWIIGVELGYSRLKREESSKEIRSISNNFLPIIVENSDTIAQLETNLDTITKLGTINNIARTVSLGFIGRRYFRLNNKLQFFIQASQNFALRNNHNVERNFLELDDSTTEVINFLDVKTKALFATTAISPGLSWNFNKFNITAKYINLSFTYGKRGQPNHQVQNFSDANLNVGINSLLIGLEYKW